MTKADLGELLERVEGAPGANYALDLAIRSALLGDAVNPGAPYTASIDAAVGLVERVLPGEVVEMSIAKACCFAKITDGEEWRGITHAPTAPLAILAALLKALIAQETSHG